ncbi:hypothetical protein BJF79_01920 [Actinomadura sp. CNU-125]|nr:hypothetical protein BJF79_01920 [Actinomadura sp. CNU-125]
MVETAGRGRLQRLAQRPVAQDRTRTEQAFDHVQRPGDIAVAEPLPDGGERLRVAVHRVDRAKARQRRSTECHQQLFPAQLCRVVVDRRQHPVPQGDPVDLAPALHSVGITGLMLRPGRGFCSGRRQRLGHKWMQPIGGDQPGPQQRQIRKDPGAASGSTGSAATA